MLIFVLGHGLLVFLVVLFISYAISRSHQKSHVRVHTAVDDWTYSVGEDGAIRARDPAGNLHTFPTWKVFWKTAHATVQKPFKRQHHRASRIVRTAVFCVIGLLLLGFMTGYINEKATPRHCAARPARHGSR